MRPRGERMVVTAISIRGRVKEACCSLARSSVNQSVRALTRSPSSSGMITSRDSFIMRRVRRGSMPIWVASEGRAPGPTPNMARPRVMWSSWTMASATMKGWV